MTSTSIGNLGHKATRGVGVTMVSQVVKIAVQVVSIVILARLLTPHDFGLVAIVAAVVGIAEVFRDFGLSTAAIQAREISEAERTNLFWANLSLGFICALASAACAPLLASIYDDQALIGITIALSLVFIINGATTQLTANVTRALNFRGLAVCVIVSQIIGVSLALTLAAFGFGYWALVAQQIATAGSLLLVTLAVGRWVPGLPKRQAPIKRFFKFGAATVGSKTFSFVAKNIDVAALGFVAPVSSVGFYSKAQELVAAPLDQINTPLTRVALPILSRVQDDDATFQRYTEKAQLVACYVTSLGLAWLAGSAYPFVTILLGERWAPVAPILSILAIAGIFRSLAQVTYWIYLAKGLVGPQLKLYAVTQALIIIGILMGLPWGPLGVACGATAGYLLFWLAGMWHVSRVARVRTLPLFRRCLMVLGLLAFPVLALSYATNWLDLNDWGQMGVSAAAAASWCALVVTAFPPFRKDALFMIGLVRRLMPNKRQNSAPSRAEN
ncbi:lipopolysaccharide biosynthesis protein [Microbacterium caowuchunii]|uniref:Lipopolysaccharide biosynthesis protein n=1 Tax=Microbacterium caowuchunii TaxID=2614638 RepID=A0A5N0TGE5_9MICO|nr:lipopolysaccharide biosynthesis protein [Microbacterium caowuchunii]KAA9132926.1 lipopolysaccharide biosynthesis protein [Microbacterium caowuchunii]